MYCTGIWLQLYCVEVLYNSLFCGNLPHFFCKKAEYFTFYMLCFFHSYQYMFLMPLSSLYLCEMITCVISLFEMLVGFFGVFLVWGCLVGFFCKK